MCVFVCYLPLFQFQVDQNCSRKRNLYKTTPTNLGDSLVAAPRKDHPSSGYGHAVATPSAELDDGEWREGRDQCGSGHGDLVRLQPKLVLIIKSPRENTAICV